MRPNATRTNALGLPAPPFPLLTPALPLARAAYKEGGPAAEARFEAGVAGFEARSFRGCGVVTSEPFEVSDDADSVQMLTRSSQIGEFYVMSPPQVEPADGKFTCDLLIYDEESDRHVRITWRDALKATLVATTGAGVGNVGGQGAKAMAGSDDDSSVWAAQAENWAKYSEGSGGTWDDTMLDCRIVIARPFIEHLMHNAILTVAGRDTGATLFGPADMQLSVSQSTTQTRWDPSIP